MAEKIRLTKTGITAPMFCEPAAVDYWVNERGWVIDPTDQVPGPPGSQPVTHDELDAFGLTDLADVTTTGAAVGQLVAVGQVTAGAPTFELVDTTEITPGDIGAQVADPDLTALAALTAANDDVIQRKSGAWANRTIAQLKTDLGVSTDIATAIASLAPAQTTIYLSAAALGSIGGSPGIASAGAGGFVESWSLDQTANETLGTTVRLPAGWSTYSIKVRGALFATGAGDVVLRASYGAKTVGDNLTTGFVTGAAITLTAGAIGVMQEVTLAAGVAADPTKDTVISVGRRASDVADTLAADYGITAVILTKES